MNVAHSATAHAAKAGSVTGAHHLKGSAQPAGNDAGGADGFMSLFSSLGLDADAGAQPNAAKDADGSLVAGNGLGADGGLLANGLAAPDPLALPGQAAAVTAVNTAVVADGDGAAAAPSPGLAALAATALPVGKGSGAATPAAAGQTGGEDAAGQAAQAKQADGAAQTAVAADHRRGHAERQGDSEILTALKAQLQSLDASGSTPANAAAVQPADGRGTNTAAAQVAQAKPSEVQLADTRVAAELRMADSSRQVDASAFKAPGSEAQLLVASADPGLRDVQKASERTGKGEGAGLGAAPGQPFAVTAGAANDRPSASVDASSLVAPEVQVAEQVNYWVSREVQSAELKLDGLGANPVEVSISLVGQEAHVEFRTDQPEIRQVLENAMSHLKDMLSSEGLNLTGTTVGTSAQGGQANQESKSRGDMRQAKIALASLAPAQTGRRMDTNLGSAVDYFV
jgi:flagellar hook-length control protein FliK